METAEKNGGALPKRQAGCPGPEGINNYRRSPHSFPQEAWAIEATHVGSQDEASSTPRKRRVRRFSPAGGKNNIIVTPTVCLDVISLVASSWGYNRGEIEQRVAQ